MKKEVKVDWNKMHFNTKIFTILSAVSLLIIIISLIIGIWLPSYPTFKVVATCIITFSIGGYVIRVDCLDENGDVKEKLRKIDNG